MDADLETTLVSGLSYSFYAVADAVVTVVDSDAAMTACGLSSYCSAVAALAAATEADVDAAAKTTAATKRYLLKKRQGF